MSKEFSLIFTYSAKMFSVTLHIFLGSEKYCKNYRYKKLICLCFAEWYTVVNVHAFKKSSLSKFEIFFEISSNMISLFWIDISI